jgi:hypothetical protein
VAGSAFGGFKKRESPMNVRGIGEKIRFSKGYTAFQRRADRRPALTITHRHRRRDDERPPPP